MDSEQPKTRQGDPERQSGWTPRPDPTSLTTEALTREIAALHFLMETRLDALKANIDGALHAIGDRFLAIEAHRVEQKQDATIALNAALSSAKEAVKEQNTASTLAINKSEAATAEQLKALTATFQAAIAGVTNELSGVKERVGKIENIKVGTQERRAGISNTAALAGTLVGIFVAVVTVVITIINVTR